MGDRAKNLYTLMCWSLSSVGVTKENQDLLPFAIADEASCSNTDIGDDRLGDEEWSLINSPNDNSQEVAKVNLSVDCELVTIMETIKGQLEVTNTHVYFLDCSPNKVEGKDH